MRNFLLFIAKFHAFFLFVILEIAALHFTFQSNTFHADFLFNTSKEYSGMWFEKRDEVTEYWKLKEKNEQLQQENARLLELKHNLYSNAKDTNRIKDVITDQFTFIPGKIINLTNQKNYNYITIDKGLNEGVEKNQGIVNPTGVVGIVTNVSSNYALGMSINNLNTQISVKHESSNALANLKWKGGGEHVHVVENLTRTARAQVGDTLITSGFSSIFPANIPVATISKVNSIKGSGFYLIEAKEIVDMRKLEYVYLIRRKDRQEIDSLQTLMDEER